MQHNTTNFTGMSQQGAHIESQQACLFPIFLLWTIDWGHLSRTDVATWHRHHYLYEEKSRSSRVYRREERRERKRESAAGDCRNLDTGEGRLRGKKTSDRATLTFKLSGADKSKRYFNGTYTFVLQENSRVGRYNWRDWKSRREGGPDYLSTHN